MAAPRTLAEAPPGVRVTLASPDLDSRRARRLAELGLREGALVTVLLRTSGGGRVVALADDRIALDRGTLRRLRLAAPEPEPLPLDPPGEPSP